MTTVTIALDCFVILWLFAYCGNDKDADKDDDEANNYEKMMRMMVMMMMVMMKMSMKPTWISAMCGNPSGAK